MKFVAPLLKWHPSLIRFPFFFFRVSKIGNTTALFRNSHTFSFWRSFARKKPMTNYGKPEYWDERYSRYLSLF
jgi:hypothetical protein